MAKLSGTLLTAITTVVVVGVGVLCQPAEATTVEFKNETVGAQSMHGYCLGFKEVPAPAPVGAQGVFWVSPGGKVIGWRKRDGAPGTCEGIRALQRGPQ